MATKKGKNKPLKKKMTKERDRNHDEEQSVDSSNENDYIQMINIREPLEDFLINDCNVLPLISIPMRDEECLYHDNSQSSNYALGSPFFTPPDSSPISPIPSDNPCNSSIVPEKKQRKQRIAYTEEMKSINEYIYTRFMESGKPELRKPCNIAEAIRQIYRKYKIYPISTKESLSWVYNRNKENKK